MASSNRGPSRLVQKKVSLIGFRNIAIILPECPLCSDQTQLQLELFELVCR